MYIHRVILKDIKGFSELDIVLSRESMAGSSRYAGWNVLTGGNGSGKTTVLKCIALALLGPETARALESSLTGWITHGKERGTIAVQILADEGDAFDKGRPTTGPFYAELLLERRGDDVAVQPGREFVKGKKSAINGPWSVGVGVWFAAAYGPFRRLYGTSTEAMRLMSSAGRPPRFATLFREDATLGESQNWLQELRFKMLEGKTTEVTLLAEITELLNSDFLRHGLRVDKVDSGGLWLVDKKGVILSLADMSDGYRASLALLVDIARHLSLAHPNRPLISRENGRVFVPYHGVVLIDEVDAHLHPEWQRDIGFWLKQHFPNIQFIVSSHSAFVCQAADELGIFTLDDLDIEADPRLNRDSWERIVSGTVDQVLLSPAFGLIHTRSPEAVAKRKEWSDLRAKFKRSGLAKEEEERMQQLSLFATDDFDDSGTQE
jgi:energy-coupling factor transporter ATP-binding protein EcfA2